MIDLLAYSFFQHALFGALLVSIFSGIIGTYIVTRRLVFISGGITHASFGGLGLGFYANINPVMTAIVTAVLSAFGVQWLNRKHNIREDSAIAVVWALGMALGIIFIFMSPGFTPNLTEYLFGNILTITQTDLIIFSVYTLALIAFSIICLHLIISVAFDAEFARVRQIPTSIIEHIMLVFIAIGIVLSIRMIGIVLLMSVLTIPQMITNLFTKRYYKIMIGSVIVCSIACVGGLYLSYLLNVPAGATIVCLLTVIFGIAKLIVFINTFTKNKTQ